MRGGSRRSASNWRYKIIKGYKRRAQKFEDEATTPEEKAVWGEVREWFESILHQRRLNENDAIVLDPSAALKPGWKARSFLDFELHAYTPRTKKWWVKSKSTGEVLGEVAWHAPWSQYCFNTEEIVLSVGCSEEINEFIEKGMEEWRRIENTGTEQCPECKSFMQVGRKEAYAKRQDGSTVTIYLVVKHCPKCQHVESEDYKKRVKEMGLKPY